MKFIETSRVYCTSRVEFDDISKAEWAQESLTRVPLYVRMYVYVCY